MFAQRSISTLNIHFSHTEESHFNPVSFWIFETSVSVPPPQRKENNLQNKF